MKYLQYALQNNEIVSIYNVPNGLKCGCVCPECGATLIARQGKKRTYHFAHFNAEECKKSIETALHLLAKQIIYKKKRLYVPSIPTVLNSIGKITEYDEAIEEMNIDDKVRPDVLLKVRMDLWGAGLALNVEIKVSHAVDETKKYKLFELGMPTVEIDISDVGADYTEESIEKIILEGKKTKWIYHPRAKNYFTEDWLCDIKVSKNYYGRFFVEYCPLNELKTVSGRWWSEVKCHDCGFSDAFCYKKHIKCMGNLKGVDINGIQKIEKVERDRGRLKSIDLIVNGERIHREFCTTPVFTGDGRRIYD